MEIHKLSVLALCAFFLTVHIGAQTPEVSERVVVEEIKLSVAAYDSAGRYSSELSKEDLVISEDGRLHRAQSVRRIPANVILMVDTGAEMGSHLSLFRHAAASFLTSLNARDSVAVFQIGDSLKMLSDWTNDRSAAAASLKKLGFAKRSSVDRSIIGAVDFANEWPGENRHLVMITNGVDGLRDSAARKEAVTKMLSGDVTVHVFNLSELQKGDIAAQRAIFIEGEPKPRRLPEEIVEILPDPKYPGEKTKRITQKDMAKMPRLASISLDRERGSAASKRRAELELAEEFLNTLAKGTGGIALKPGSASAFADAMGGLAQNIDARHLVTYVPRRSLAESPNGEIRDIVVTSKTPGIRVEAQRRLLAKRP